MVALVNRLREVVAGGLAAAIAAVQGMSVDTIRGWLRALADPAGRGGRALLVGGVAGALLCILLVSLRQATPRAREADFDVTLVCAACGEAFGATREETFDLIDRARSAGHRDVGTGADQPLGLCPKCGKAAVYRARECPRCGKPVPPGFAAVDGKRITPACRSCGWTRASGRRP